LRIEADRQFHEGPAEFHGCEEYPSAAVPPIRKARRAGAGAGHDRSLNGRLIQAFERRKELQ
jgi:hypothetical protein